MEKKFSLAFMVAIIASIILVMSGCTTPTPPAPIEKVLDISKLGPLYEKGSEVKMLNCGITTYEWKDCDGGLHSGTKFVPDEKFSVVAEGNPVNLSERLGVTDGKELVLRDKKAPVPEAKKPKASTPSTSDSSNVTNWNSIPWYLLGYLLLIVLAILALFTIWGLLRRLIVWMSEPLSVRTSTTTTSSHSGHSSTSGQSSEGGCPPIVTHGNLDGSVIVHRAGHMVKRTTTVTEEFATYNREPRASDSKGH